MAAQKFTRKQREAFQAEIAELSEQGCSQARIGSKFNISQQTVSYNLRQIQLKHALQRDRNIEATRDRQTGSTNLIKEKTWEILKKTQCPEVMLKALSIAQRADDQINRVTHVYNIPPQFSLAEELEGASEEEVQVAYDELYTTDYEDEDEGKDNQEQLSSLECLTKRVSWH